MSRRIELVDVSLRDGNQSLWGATGVTTRMVEGVTPALDRVGCLAADPVQGRRRGVNCMTGLGQRIRDLLDPAGHDREQARAEAIGDELRLAGVLSLGQKPELLDQLGALDLILQRRDQRFDLRRICRFWWGILRHCRGRGEQEGRHGQDEQAQTPKHCHNQRLPPSARRRGEYSFGSPLASKSARPAKSASAVAVWLAA